MEIKRTLVFPVAASALRFGIIFFIPKPTRRTSFGYHSYYLSLASCVVLGAFCFLNFRLAKMFPNGSFGTRLGFADKRVSSFFFWECGLVNSTVAKKAHRERCFWHQMIPYTQSNSWLLSWMQFSTKTTNSPSVLQLPPPGQFAIDGWATHSLFRRTTCKIYIYSFLVEEPGSKNHNIDSTHQAEEPSR